METILESLIKVNDFKALTKKDLVVCIGGTNDISPSSVEDRQAFLASQGKYLRQKLDLFSHTNLILATIPYRYDLDAESKENKLIKELNLVIRQLSYNLSHIRILDLYLLQSWYHTRHGLHVNKRGKRFIAKEIMKLAENLLEDTAPISSPITTFPRTAPCVLLALNKDARVLKTPDATGNRLSPDSLTTPIQIIDTDMDQVIKQFKDNPSIGFAHCISGDLDDQRQMSKGVAVKFRNNFGRPKLSDLLHRNLTTQYTVSQAVVYGLVTKGKFNAKPTEQEYNEAFCQLIKDFKDRKLNKLICSPMGCMRDNIPPQLFARNISLFHRQTNATVDIIVQDERASRNLRNGLEHEDFVNLLRNCVIEELRQYDISSSAATTHRRSSQGVSQSPEPSVVNVSSSAVSNVSGFLGNLSSQNRKS